MSGTTGLYELPQTNNEMYLLDNLPLEDRKKDLRQLIKLLSLAKTGQAKSVLICGDDGIGKTALLNTFCDIIRQGMYCRILDLRHVRLESAEKLYVSIIEAFQTEANEILDEALEAVNEINAELGIQWNRQDLVRSIALVKLQESIGGKDALTQERLAKAIKSSIPTVKKLKFSTVNDNIERLVNIIVNPWLLVATNLVNPLVPELQEAIQLARQIKKESLVPDLAPAQEPDLDIVDVETGPASSNGSATLPEDLAVDVEAVDAELDASAMPAFDPIELSEQEPDDPADTPETGLDLYGTTSLEASKGFGADVDVPVRRRRHFDNPMDRMTYHLGEVFSFVNKAIGPLDSGLFMAIDGWEQILELPETQSAEVKEFMATFLRETVDKKKCHLMVALCNRSAGESDSLGGPLYSLFRNKLLLTGISDRVRRKFFLKPLREAGIKVDESVLYDVFRLTRGNPFWLLKMRHYLKERAESNKITELDLEFYRKLGIEKLEDLFESSFTRIELAYLNEEENLHKVIAALVKHFGETPFNVQEAVTELSVSQGVSELFVAEILRHLYLHDFVVEIQDKQSFEPCYQIQSRPIFNYLSVKTQSIQTDVSTEEKIAYLRKIIPLSVKSGELDRQKTNEIIALSTTMGNDEMIQFLQDTFLEYLTDESPIVRVTALNNLAIIDSDASMTAILEAMRDKDATVREYAARNLAVLSRKPREPKFHDDIVAVLIDAIDDESEAVRAQVYATLARYKWSRDLLSVFLKGLADASESVRVTSIQNLVELDVDTPLVRATYLDATDDKSAVVRRFACLGIQRYQDEEAIEILTETLRSDPETSIRALAADVISSMDSEKAFEALVDALETDDDEDVKLTIVRALGKRKGWQTEELMIETIDHDPQLEQHSPALLWACVRTLGLVAGTERSLDLLGRLGDQVTNDIIQMAIHVSSRKIQERLDELRQMERQLQSATPTTVVIKGGHDEEEEAYLTEDDEV